MAKHEPELVRIPKPPTTSVSEEFDAMRIIIEEFKKLDKDAQQRVFGYIASRFNLSLRSSDY